MNSLGLLFILASLLFVLSWPPRADAQPPRIKSIIRTLLILLLWGAGFLNLRVFRPVAIQPRIDPVTLSERRFQQLRWTLSGVDRVGYIGEGEPRAAILAQYSLAPVIVEPGTSPNLIVGNFEHSKADPVPENLILVRDFGDGVMLFRKRTE